MKIYCIIKKTLIEACRELHLIAIYLLFPPLMIIIYFYSFGGADPSIAQYLHLLVLNHDRGQWSSALVDAIRAEEFEGKKAFTVEMVASREQALPLLFERKAALLVEIPENFSQQLEEPNTRPATIVLVGDPGSDMAAFAGSFLSSTVDKFGATITGWTQPDPVRYEFLPGTGKLSDFQFGVPGLIVFGILFGIITSALVMTRESVRGTARRLRLAGVTAFDIVTGVTITQLIEIVLQVLLTIVTALMLGFKTTGSLLLVFFVCMLTGLCATGFGMLTASLSKNDGDATNIGTVFFAGLVFLSGAVYPMPPLPVGTVLGYTISLYDILPATHAAEALRRVMIYGDGLQAITYYLGGLALLSLGIYGLGIWTFQQLCLNRDL